MITSDYNVYTLEQSCIALSTLECLYDCLFNSVFLFYQNELILILMYS